MASHFIHLFFVLFFFLNIFYSFNPQYETSFRYNIYRCKSFVRIVIWVVYICKFYLMKSYCVCLSHWDYARLFVYMGECVDCMETSINWLFYNFYFYRYSMDFFWLFVCLLWWNSHLFFQNELKRLIRIIFWFHV